MIADEVRAGRSRDRAARRRSRDQGRLRDLPRAINFGSGWWPTSRKRPGLSDYSTVAAGVTERFRDAGPWTAAELSPLIAADVAATLGQDPAHPLMEDFARALRDVGNHLAAEYDGRFEQLVDASAGSALALVGVLADWEAFADASVYMGRRVPFFKRAQLAAADLDHAGVASFPDTDRLTAFADNLVPHVLRVDGVLQLDPQLERRIETGELLEHGSPEEVELRAGAVHVVELRAAAGEQLSPVEIDAILWNRGCEAATSRSPAHAPAHNVLAGPSHRLIVAQPRRNFV